eukprot:7577596-Pyramimonas_sp.AAC.1
MGCATAAQGQVKEATVGALETTLDALRAGRLGPHDVNTLFDGNGRVNSHWVSPPSRWARKTYETNTGPFGGLLKLL